MASSPIVLAVLAMGMSAGAFIDLRTRRVPNVLTMTLATIGIGCAAGGISGLTVVASVLGLALGLGLMLPGYLFGATGAGDVKLLAAAGALLGPAHIVLAFVYMALAGGVLALVVARQRSRLAITLEGTGQLITTGAANAAAIEHPAANNRFAYAPAIAVGSVLAAFGL